MPYNSVRYVAEGFEEDVGTIITLFEDLQSMKFKDFAKLWRGVSFSLVYMGRESEREMCEFTNECFLIITNYMIQNVGMRRKVGALYLLYGMYYKQPLGTKYKIRLQIRHWQEILKLLDFGLKQHHDCICYIINKMYTEHAFHFVAFPRMLGPQTTLTYEPWKSATNDVDNYKAIFKECLERGNLETLNNLHTQYEAFKKNLCKVQVGLSSNPLLPNKYTEITRAFRSLAYHQVPDYKALASIFKTKNEKENRKDTDNIGSRRSQIKQKQFAAQSSAHTSKRCEELLHELKSEQDEDAPSEETEVDNTPSKPGRKGRKTKTKRKMASKSATSSENEARVKKRIKAAEMDASFVPEINVVDGKPVQSFNGRKIELRKRAEKGRRTKFHFASSSEEDPFGLSSEEGDVSCEEDDVNCEEEDVNCEEEDVNCEMDEDANCEEEDVDCID